jgi:MFS family permease
LAATTLDGGSLVDSRYAWGRLAVALALNTLGGIGMWSVVVALPAVQADFAIDRGQASFSYTVTMVGYALGGVMMGRLADRFGVAAIVAAGTLSMAAGYVLAGLSAAPWQFTLAQGVLVAFFGSSATFGPLMADTSFWFARRRGIAVAVCAAGNYLAGAIWPPLVQHFIGTAGWRATHMAIGAVAIVTMLPLAAFLRGRAPRPAQAVPAIGARRAEVLGMAPAVVQALLAAAGVACCVAMAVPQVHIVAYCGDLGYGPASGATMLSLMLGFGVVSRLGSGFIADRIGGIRTMLIGSALQALALVLYYLFDGLSSLYVISALFGLFQGGIIPAYAIIVRELFPAREAATRVGVVIMATVLGMALGGWMAGAIFDLAHGYGPAFLNAIGWNLFNLAIAVFLLRRFQIRAIA